MAYQVYHPLSFPVDGIIGRRTIRAFDASKMRDPFTEEKRVFRLPRYFGAYPKSLIVGSELRANMDCQIFQAASPPSVSADLTRSSTADERAATFAIAHSIAHRVGSLFFCTQLSRDVSGTIKNQILDSGANWEEHVSDIYSYIDGNPNYTLTNEEMHWTFPIDPIVEIAMSHIGANLSTESLYVNMIPDGSALRFPLVSRDKLAREGPSAVPKGSVKVPVVYVEPLRTFVPPEGGCVLLGQEARAPFHEPQLFVMAGDVIIVPFHSDMMTVSLAHNIALARAARHGVGEVRVIIAWDLRSGQIVAHKYW